MGCDSCVTNSSRCGRFQSTHPVWNATLRRHTRPVRGRDFNPRIPYGMRRWACRIIHPVRPNFNPRIPYGMRRAQVRSDCHHPYFNPRIPYGMRRARVSEALGLNVISIHASRMGCDPAVSACLSCVTDFNPRIPYGMRP